MKNPIDLLPIKKPLQDSSELDDMYFYNNVIQHLIPDIIKLEANGIPINLDKVKEVENTVNNVLDNVTSTLGNNNLITKFLERRFKTISDNDIEDSNKKSKTVDEFLKPYVPSNIIHRSFVVNEYLISIGKDDMVMDKWTIRDLKQLNQLIASKFIYCLINNDIVEYMTPIIVSAMYKLAKTKADIHNKNNLNKLTEKLENKRINLVFNPGSTQQKQEFFTFYGIDSENKTKSGNPQWDRKELERLNEYLNILIDLKEE